MIVEDGFEKKRSLKKITWLLVAMGVVPALIIVLFLDIRDGRLMVLGTSWTELDLPRLMAALLSILSPVFLLLPLALGDMGHSRPRSLLAAALVGPFLLLGPCLLAGWWIGATGFGVALAAPAALCPLLLAFMLWVVALQRIFGHRVAVLLYGAIWASAAFADYLNLYILPNLESKALAGVSILIWALPQVEGGFNLIDDYLQTGRWDWWRFGPTLIQIALLGCWLWLLPILRRERKSGSPGERLR